MHYPGDPRTRTSRIHIGGAELAERRSLTPRPQRAATSALDRLSGRPEYSPASRYRCPPPARADGDPRAIIGSLAGTRATDRWSGSAAEPAHVPLAGPARRRCRPATVAEVVRGGLASQWPASDRRALRVEIGR